MKIPDEKFQNIIKFCTDNNLNLNEVFIFNVKNKEYFISKASAILGSETILNEFHKDKTILSFNIDIDDPNNLFNDIISLLQGDTILIMQEDYLFYFQVISLLKIESIYPQIQQKLFNEELKLINCINLLKFKELFKLPIDNEIDMISKNICNFKAEEILKINKDVLIQILNNKSFLIKNEDIFFRLIEEINQKNQNFQFMFDYVHFEKLSKEILNEPTFKNFVFKSDIVKINRLLYHAIANENIEFIKILLNQSGISINEVFITFLNLKFIF